MSSREPSSRSSLLLRLIDSAGALAAITGIFYYFGWNYYVGYFGELGIQGEWIDLPTSVYLVRAFTVMYLTLGLFVPSLNPQLIRPPDPTSRISTIIVNLTTVSIIGAIVGRLYFLNEKWFVLVAFTILWGVAYLLARVNFSIPYFYAKTSWFARAGIVLSFIMILGLVAGSEGRRDAKGILSGDSDNTTVIVLQLQDASSPLGNRPLLLAAHRGGNYYLVDGVGSTEKEPAVFVVPESQVLSAQLQPRT